jgi:hypothetical protein
MRLFALAIHVLEKMQAYREILDLPIKAYLKTKGKFRDYSALDSNDSHQRSDSENLEYSNYVERVSSNPHGLANFRRPYVYRQILEHVNWKFGRLYLERFVDLGGDPKEINRVAAHDDVGNPRKYFYSEYGWLNPTQIRYLSVKQELANLFDMESIDTVGEIGCGFGGQYVTLARSYELKEYHFYDLAAVQRIIKFYLSNFTLRTTSIFPSIKSITPKSFDLVISNYAFSELPKSVQLEYIEKILFNSKRGYMIMNSGKSNETARGDGKMSLVEIREHLPWIKTTLEIPLTGPDNYVIYWDRSKR